MIAKDRVCFFRLLVRIVQLAVGSWQLIFSFSLLAFTAP